MKIKILTLFPNMFTGILGESILKRAIEANVCSVEVIDMRNYSLNKHHHVDDTPYGGGAGMVLACDVVDRAIQANTTDISYKVLMTPQGRPYKQSIAQELASKEELILICGHYEGFDERIRNYVDDEISIGDYVLTGGELAAGVVCDSVIRLLEHAIRKESIEDDSFSNGLLEYPQYTRPLEYKGVCVPEVLVNGNHKLIFEYRLKESLRKTFLRRPDLLQGRVSSLLEKKLLKEVVKEEGISLVDLSAILSEYNITYQNITKKINTSFEDFRFVIILDNSYVLRLADKKIITEQRISEMDRLVQRYMQIGIYAPRFIQTKEKHFTTIYKNMVCYITEYGDFPLAEDLNLESQELNQQVLPHLGIFASKFSNVDLVDARSMWSILDLALLDEKIDEKQENLNDLVKTLKEIKEDELAMKLDEFNQINRAAILNVFSSLPRCVFQGDLNPSNLLMKNNQFYGLIDFNMSGTEVNINCFLSETNIDPTEEDFEKLKPQEILDKQILKQDELMQLILENYTLNEIEKSVYENYRSIVLISQYPNVCSLQYFLKTQYKEKVIEYIKCILNR